MQFKNLLGLFLFGFLLLAKVSGASAEDIPLDARYDEIFPIYAEACTLSQLKSKDSKVVPGGTIFGHEVLYIKGMCPVENSAFPQVKRCSGSANRSTYRANRNNLVEAEIEVDTLTHEYVGPATGTMISSIRKVANANWVAVPGPYLAFHGGLPNGTPINSEMIDLVGRFAFEASIFNGITLRQKWETDRKKKGIPFYNYIARESVGTDFSIDFGRTSYCNLIPISEQQLLDMIEYLNAVNNPYHYLSHRFKWHTTNNNCAHIVRNTLAAASILTFKETGKPLLSGRREIQIPSNLFLEIAGKGKPTPLPEVQSLYWDEISRNSILKYDRLPFHPGTLTTKIKMRDGKNDIFRSSKKSFVLDFSITGKKRKDFYSIPQNSQFSKLDEVLRNSKTYLELALQTLPPLEGILDYDRQLRSRKHNENFRIFYNKYKQWLVRTIAEIEEHLSPPASIHKGSPEQSQHWEIEV